MLSQTRCLRTIWITLLALLAGAAFAANAPSQPAQKKTAPQVQVITADVPPVIDGKLDDACWSKAPQLTGFFSPDVNEPVPEETIGMICADDTAIYVGFICKDRTPADIKAVETRRNGAVFDDDLVEFGLDPWHQHQGMYVFRVTASGIQSEDIPGGSATKIEWRGDWTGAAARTPEGWTAEMAIPFSILRYPAGQTTFGFYLGRHFGAERIWIVHPVTGTGKGWDQTLVCDLCGLRPPVYKPRPIFMPYLVADVGESPGRHFNTGLDVQYRMPNGLTSLAALNPDFTQIEEAIEPVSFSYTEKYLPELRPFFITGQGYLPGDLMLYTRRIEDFDAGVKLFGTVGNNSYGFLDAIRHGVENTLAAQTTHKFSDTFDMTFRLVDHRTVDGPENIVWGFDGGHHRRSEDGEDILWGMFRQSLWQDDGSGALYNLGGVHFRGSGKPHYDWNLQLATDFNPALGFFYDQNSVGGNASYGVWNHYDKGKTEFRGWNTFVQYVPYLHGEGMLHQRVSGEYFMKLRRGYFFATGFGLGREYNQNSSDVGFHFGWSDNDMYRRGGIDLTRGTRAGGDYTYGRIDQGLHPRKNLSVRTGIEYSHLAPPSPDAYHAYQGVVTATYDLTPEKCISARLVARDGGTNLYAAYRQVVRRGTDVYIIVGDPDPERTGLTARLAVKLIRVF